MISLSDLSHLICYVSLTSDDGSQMLDTASISDGGHQGSHRMLYGSLVSSPSYDATGTRVLFVFNDVSVRHEGTYRLWASLMDITGLVRRLFATQRRAVSPS
jgi:hypothetical protein